MPNVQPFKALVYSEKNRNDLSDLISPPYDVLSHEQFLAMKAKNKFQSVRLCIAEDSADPDRYKKMKNLLGEWKQAGVMTHQSQPAFYLIEERYTEGGKSSTRIGFVGLLETSPFPEGKVLPHEHTLSGPKKDRLELIQTMRAEMSQIFLCYQDPTLTLEKIYDSVKSTTPLMVCEDPQSIHRRVWPLTDAVQVKAIQNLLADKKVLIADGHHRYETALAFRDQSKYVQCYFTNLNTPGFSIRPIHRLFTLPPQLSTDAFLTQLKQKFEVTPWNEPISLEALMRLRSEKRMALICSIAATKQNFLLTQTKKTEKDEEIFAIHRDIFEGILSWDVSSLAKGTIQYEHETAAFEKTLTRIENGIGLFLPPTDLNVVMRLAEQGERMPQKSTFFYPKLASGLINLDLDCY